MAVRLSRRRTDSYLQRWSLSLHPIDRCADGFYSGVLESLVWRAWEPLPIEPLLLFGSSSPRKWEGRLDPRSCILTHSRGQIQGCMLHGSVTAPCSSRLTEPPFSPIPFSAIASV